MTSTERKEKKSQFSMMRQQGFKLRDISKEIGIPERTLKSWVAKDKDSFKKRTFDKNIVIEMKYDGKTNKEISDVLNVSESTIVKFLKNVSLPYIDFYSGEIVEIRDIIPKDFQLFNFLKLNLGEEFNHIKFRNMFLKEDSFHKANYFYKKEPICVFSQKHYEYFEECLLNFVEKGSLYRVKSNGMISGIGFYGTNRWKKYAVEIASFIHKYNKSTNRLELITEYLNGEIKDGRRYFIYGCARELFENIRHINDFNFDSVSSIKDGIMKLPSKIYYVTKNYNDLSPELRKLLKNQKDRNEVLCSKSRTKQKYLTDEEQSFIDRYEDYYMEQQNYISEEWLI